MNKIFWAIKNRKTNKYASGGYEYTGYTYDINKAFLHETKTQAKNEIEHSPNRDVEYPVKIRVTTTREET